MKTYHSGIDHFSSDIDKPPKTDRKCRACGQILKGEKTVGARSWAGAMARTKSEYYTYDCPHAGVGLHDDIVKLILEQEDLVSEKLKAIVQSEIEEKRKALQGLIA
jgi:hypothetical protein